ncbi:MAG: VIT1/CCC1 transporter family protein [Patescibacteria group bacterium]|nr:VIT1/CCC1 transporter family protein [Patescibacteria group bacterium]
MKTSIKKGFSFGLTSGIITTLGLIVGLNSGTHSKTVVLGGILIIAIADAMSDALGVHISEESENQHKPNEIWESTFATFFSKFIFALTFVIPILVFPLNVAIIVSIIWGLSLIVIMSFLIAKQEKAKPWSIIFEHLGITILVIIATYFVGGWINKTFI